MDCFLKCVWQVIKRDRFVCESYRVCEWRQVPGESETWYSSLQTQETCVFLEQNKIQVCHILQIYFENVMKTVVCSLQFNLLVTFLSLADKGSPSYTQTQSRVDHFPEWPPLAWSRWHGSVSSRTGSERNHSFIQQYNTVNKPMNLNISTLKEKKRRKEGYDGQDMEIKWGADDADWISFYF